MTETKQELRSKIKKLEEKIEDLEYELDRLNEAYCDLENQLCEEPETNIDYEALREIVKQIDYRIINHRRLETIDDVSTAIKKALCW